MPPHSESSLDGENKKDSSILCSLFPLSSVISCGGLVSAPVSRPGCLGVRAQESSSGGSFLLSRLTLTAHVEKQERKLR